MAQHGTANLKPEIRNLSLLNLKLNRYWYIYMLSPAKTLAVDPQNTLQIQMTATLHFDAIQHNLT